MLAAPAIGEDLPAVQPPLAMPAAEAPVPLPPAEPPVEVISPAQVSGDAVTFDSMESIPFENAVEPPDEPPPLDNTVRAPGLDNTVPQLPGIPAAPGAPPVPGMPATPEAPPAPATPGVAAPPPPPVNLRAQ
jgi:hypothetical protein